MTEFPIIPQKTGLLFFDCLNADLHPENPVMEVYVRDVLPALVKMNQACREAGIAVFYTQPEDRPDDREFSPQIVDLGSTGKHDDGVGTRMTRHGARPAKVLEIAPELAPQAGDYIIRKKRWSAFSHTHLDLSLRRAGIDTIILGGGGLRVGIASTAYWARDLDYNLIILRDGTWSNRSAEARPEEVHELLLREVFPVFARVRTVDEVIAEIRR
jgi:nicotinamidase-related amidase